MYGWQFILLEGGVILNMLSITKVLPSCRMCRFLTLLLLLSFLFSACSPEPLPFPYPTRILGGALIASDPDPITDSLFASEKVADKCDISLYLDATMSMSGFAKLNRPGAYERVLQQIENASILSFKNYTMDYFRFWEKPVAISREQFRIDAFTPEFYHYSQAGDDNDPIQTNLLKVFQAVGNDISKPDNALAIIVTDFVSTSESDRADVINYLNERFLRRGFSVSIVGIRADFNGRVPDIISDGKNYTFSYEGKRPYYLIILGNSANSQVFIDQLKKNVKQEIPDLDLQTATIVGQSIQRPVALSWGQIREEEAYEHLINPASLDHLLSPQTMQQTGANQVDAMQLFYEILLEKPEFSSPEMIINWENPYRSDTQAILQLRKWQYRCQVRFETGSKIDQVTGDILAGTEPNLMISDQAPDFLSLSNPEQNGADRAVQMHLVFDMKNMPKDQVYLIRFDLFGTPEFSQKTHPSWIDSWTMNLKKLDEWNKDTSLFEGNTTPYLRDLVATLWQKCASDTADMPELPIGTYTMAIINCEPDDALRNSIIDIID
ncbi:MAG: hypothetical protein GX825_06105 [Syntrophomonadaceae bacterium]|nr:hypothetical protein [Syntrophomonadaceae bacterium]